MSSHYIPRFPPFKHQDAALDFLGRRPEFPSDADVAAWLMEFGTGKSKVIIDEFGIRELMGDLDTLLIIAPKGVYMNWVNIELPTHLSEDLKERALIGTLDLAGGRETRARIEKLIFTRGRPRILVVNVEAFSVVERVRESAINFLNGCYDTSMIAIDECFVAGTQVSTPFGQRPIETLCIGDEIIGSFDVTRVKNVFKRKTRKLIYVYFENGHKICVTQNHPFFTDLGWVCAGNLQGRILYDRTTVRSLWENIFSEKNASTWQRQILQQNLFRKMAQVRRKTFRETMCLLWKEFLSKEITINQQYESRSRQVLRQILLSEMENVPARYSNSSLYIGTFSQNQYDIVRWTIKRSPYVEQRSSLARGTQEVNQQECEKTRLDGGAWRQWSAAAPSSIDVTRDNGGSMDHGICNRVGWEAAWLSYMLQSRFRQPQREACNRMRWIQSQFTGTQSQGQKERSEITGIRVARVETIQLENPTDVYDIELEGCPHFFAENVLVHNCTRIKTEGHYKVRGGISGSKRSAFVVEKLAPLARVRRIATGLVAPNSPLDVYMPYAFLDPRILGMPTYQAFKQRYCIMQYTDFVPKRLKAQGVFGKERGIIRGFRNENELNQKLSPYSFRVLKKDCLDLPPKLYQFRDIEMTPEQETIYEKLRKEAIVEFENTRVTAPMVMTRVMRLHQIACGYMVDDDENIHHLKENRIQALIEMLEDHSGKAIVWAPYRPLIQKIAAELRRAFGQETTVELWGDTKQKDRDLAIKRFREDPTCLYLVSNQSVGGAGTTLISAHLMIYHTNNWKLEDRLNSEDRIHRIGQTESCLYVDLRVPGSVEDKVIQKLRKKIDVATTIMGDEWREWLI